MYCIGGHYSTGILANLSESNLNSIFYQQIKLIIRQIFGILNNSKDDLFLLFKSNKFSISQIEFNLKMKKPQRIEIINVFL